MLFFKNTPSICPTGTVQLLAISENSSKALAPLPHQNGALESWLTPAGKLLLLSKGRLFSKQKRPCSPFLREVFEKAIPRYQEMRSIFSALPCTKVDKISIICIMSAAQSLPDARVSCLVL
jgi:hypothetical protein